MLTEWNDTTGEPVTTTLDQIIDRQVASAPERLALVFGDAALSYGELGRRTNGLAQTLRELGVDIETRVGISLTPSLAAPLAILAVLQTGGTHVPLGLSAP